MQNIENIIFDYGNVLFMIDFARAHQAFAQLGVTNVAEIFAHTTQSELFDAFDMGKISPAEFREGIRSLAEKPELTDDQIDDAWNALLLGVPQGKHELLLSLKDRYRTFLLSNNNEIHYAYIMQYLQNEYGLENNSSLFERDYYSHLMGMRKPNRDIFEHVLDQHGLKPEQTLFIDDSPQHIATARSLGLQAELLTAPDTVEALLARRGIQ